MANRRILMIGLSIAGRFVALRLSRTGCHIVINDQAPAWADDGRILGLFLQSQADVQRAGPFDRSDHDDGRRNRAPWSTQSVSSPDMCIQAERYLPNTRDQTQHG